MRKIILIFLSIMSLSLRAETDHLALRLLKTKNHFALIRHSRAPGTGDPVNFKINDCSTQRNLSQAGIAQAKSIGKKIRESFGEDVNGASSQWCRARDTAKEISPRYSDDKILNSFFQNMDFEKEFVSNFKKWIPSKIQKETPLILVTHQVNITALTGVYPREGELVIVKLLEDNSTIEVVKKLRLEK